jgi:heme-degrading monooxygenase HmoA
MFMVNFEVHAKPESADVYAKRVALLKAEIVKIDGFIDQSLYSSLNRDGWLLSLSNWRDEKALIRWRTQTTHQSLQAKCRAEVFVDYKLRIGQLTRDTRLPAGCVLLEQRLDETEAGEGTTVVLINAKRTEKFAEDTRPEVIAKWLGLTLDATGLVSREVHASVVTPGEYVLRTSWRDSQAAEAYDAVADLPGGARSRRVRVIRDYSMYDRREAPQYFPDVPRVVTTPSRQH